MTQQDVFHDPAAVNVHRSAANPVQIILDNLKAPTGVTDQIVIPVNPQEIQVQTGPKMVTYSASELGDYITARGVTPFRISFDSWFPGPGRLRRAVTNPENPAEIRVPQQAPWMPADPNAYIPAHTLAYRIEAWARNGIPLQFTMTHVGTHKFLYANVVIDAPFTFTIKGGHGDVYYRLTLVEQRKLKVWTMAEVVGPEGYAQAIAFDPNEPGVTGATYTFGGNTTAWPVMHTEGGGSPTTDDTDREVPFPPDTWTIQDGDSLEIIALKFYGRADLWPMVYENNKDALRRMQTDAGIDVPDNPYTDTIMPGYDLVMPKVTSSQWLANNPDPIEFDPPGIPVEPPFSSATPEYLENLIYSPQWLAQHPEYKGQ